MKILGLILLSLLACAPAAAQTPAGPPPSPEAHGVSVVRATWRKEVFNPALMEDPLSASDNTVRQLRERKEITRENNERSRTGRILVPLPTQATGEPKPTQTPGEPARVVTEPPPSDPRVSYLYEVKVVNKGTKKIRSLVWEYVLVDPATRSEVGRHAFETKAGIGVGKEQTLLGRSGQHPVGVVHVTKSDKEKSGQYAERVEILRVVYEGGDVWERERN
ncbi:MAG: hypothetical protein ABW250_04230 [Pyrinomonadaceae bacterium]